MPGKTEKHSPRSKQEVTILSIEVEKRSIPYYGQRANTASTAD
jgi:hypothetical protein